MNFSYQFVIRKYAILGINETTPRQKIERIYFLKGDGKGGKQRTANNLQNSEKAYIWKDTWDDTNTREGHETKDRSDMDVYPQRI